MMAPAAPKSVQTKSSAASAERPKTKKEDDTSAASADKKQEAKRKEEIQEDKSSSYEYYSEEEEDEDKEDDGEPEREASSSSSLQVHMVDAKTPPPVSAAAASAAEKPAAPAAEKPAASAEKKTKKDKAEKKTKKDKKDKKDKQEKKKVTHRLIRPAQSQCASSRTHTGLKLRGAGGKSKVRLAVTAKCRHPAVPCLRWGRCWSGRTTTPGELKPQLEMPRRHRRPGRDVGVRSLPGREGIRPRSGCRGRSSEQRQTAPPVGTVRQVPK